jgi:hypothetical protein
MVVNQRIAPYQGVFYFSDTLLIPDLNSLVNVSDLLALTDITSATVNYWDHGYTEKQENEAITGVGFIKTENSVQRPSLTLRLSPYKIPEENADFLLLLSKFRKRYKYFRDLIPIDSSNPIGNSTQAVYLVTKFDAPAMTGYRNIVVNAEYPKVYT